MIRIASNSEMRQVQKLPFCYVCGADFPTSNQISRDHVPPKGIFSAKDRLDLLWLPAHTLCNNACSVEDEKIGKLLGIQHRKYLTPQDARLLKMGTFRDRKSGAGMLAFAGIDMKGIIARWLRGFHAALYKEFLPIETPNAIHPPFPCAEIKSVGVVPEQLLVQHPVFVEAVKKNRMAGRIDTIITANGNCLYECTWEQDDQNRWMCIFALKIYNWQELGDRESFPIRGCTGFYSPRSGKPNGAVTGICRTLEMPLLSGNPLDPF